MCGGVGGLGYHLEYDIIHKFSWMNAKNLKMCDQQDQNDLFNYACMDKIYLAITYLVRHNIFLDEV